MDGSAAVTSLPWPSDSPVSYLYFRVDDDYMYDEVDRSAELTVVFRDDGGCAQIHVEYDNTDSQTGARSGAFRPTRPINVGSSNTWRTVKLILPQTRFIGRANGADFRLAVLGHSRRLTVREVIVRKLPGVEMELDTGTQ